MNSLFHPPPYVEKQIRPVLINNLMPKEVVWTFLVAKKYENNQQALVKKLCGVDEPIPEDSRIWLEAYLHPTRMRQEEVKYWRSRADLSVGCLEFAKARDSQIQSNGDWICIAEAKWYDDIHPNSKFPNILQYSQIIEHALLMHDKDGNFPKRVYVTLITPKYFKDNQGKFSKRNYWQKYHDYQTSRTLLENDLRLCPLTFLSHDEEILLERVKSLTLNWVTFEELLGLPDLVIDNIPGKYKTTITSWKEVFEEIGEKELYGELVGLKTEEQKQL
jgi:hypothetical protein